MSDPPNAPVSPRTSRRQVPAGLKIYSAPRLSWTRWKLRGARHRGNVVITSSRPVQLRRARTRTRTSTTRRCSRRRLRLRQVCGSLIPTSRSGRNARRQRGRTIGFRKSLNAKRLPSALKVPEVLNSGRQSTAICLLSIGGVRRPRRIMSLFRIPTPYLRISLCQIPPPPSDPRSQAREGKSRNDPTHRCRAFKTTSFRPLLMSRNRLLVHPRWQRGKMKHPLPRLLRVRTLRTHYITTWHPDYSLRRRGRGVRSSPRGTSSGSSVGAASAHCHDVASRK